MRNQTVEKIGVTGHRGCKAYIAENTLESFREAFRLDVDVLEFDIHLTRDKVLVVMHDGQPGLRIPTLREALECIVNEGAPDMILNVEIKDQRPDCIDATIAMLDEFGVLDRSVIASFDAQALLYVQDNYPHVKTQGHYPVYMVQYDPRVLDRMYGMGVPLNSKRLPTDEDIMEAVKFANDHGIQAWGYHADNREQAIRAVKFGFTNITGNDPRDLIAYLDEIDRRCGK